MEQCRSPQQPWASAEDVEYLRLPCQWSTIKSVAHWHLQLGIHKMMNENVLHKMLRFYAYKILILHEIIEVEWYTRIEFAIWVLNIVTIYVFWYDQDDSFLWKVVHTDEAAFQKNGHVNIHNRCTWRQEWPHKIYDHVWDSLEVNMCSFVMHNCVIGYSLFFFLLLLKTLMWHAFTWIC